MSLKLRIATEADAPALAELRNVVAEDLTARFGQGPWSGQCTERGVLFDMKQGRVYLAEADRQPIATLRLATKKPWAIDPAYFTPVPRPVYLTAMAVRSDHQRKGLGRQCMAEALELARKWPAQAIWLDAFDAVAGAGDFYRKCGLKEAGRKVYRGVPLIYFEIATSAGIKP